MTNASIGTGNQPNPVAKHWIDGRTVLRKLSPGTSRQRKER